jgi:hypothetical protein
MATPTDHGHDPNREAVDAKTDVGPATGHAFAQHGVEAGEFDREINLRGVLWSGAAVALIGFAAAGVVWFLLRGFHELDERRDVRLTPIRTENPQGPPPEPRLQTTPEEDMRRMRAEEDLRLNRAGWVDQGRDALRVPIDVAIDVIAERGVGPEVVGGRAGTPAATANPDQVRLQQGASQPGLPGATTQMTRPKAPAQPESSPPEERR